MLNFLLEQFVSPVYFLLIILLLLMMVVLTKTDKRLFFTRAAIILILITALAEPYSPVSLFGGGSTKLAILDDQSSSYTIFGESVGKEIFEELDGSRGVRYVPFGEDTVSDVGYAIIDSMNNGENVLLLSDGNINSGKGLDEVRKTSSLENLSLSIISREIENEDYSVKITGPSKVGPDTDAMFTAVVEGVDASERAVELSVDGNVVLTGKAGEMEYSVKFGEGYHQLVARLLDPDFFNENNAYYKSVKVVEKPKVLLYGASNTPLHNSLNKLYNVDVGNLYNLERYHAVVIDDVPVSDFSERVDALEDYVAEGNGLIVFGGKNSFERDNYFGSGLEELLPVEVSGAGKKQGSIHVVVLIDISSSTTSAYGTSTAAEISKALAVNIVKDITDEHSLGVVAFNSQSYIVEPLGLLENKERPALESLIGSLKSTGSTDLGNGLTTSINLLKGKSGGKNIILITDGTTQGEVYGAVNLANSSDVKIYPVAVGSNPNEILLRSISNSTGGGYYWAAQSHQLSFVFGDPDEGNEKSSEIKIYDDSHFITEGLLLSAKVHGTNKVLPKDSAKLLLNSGNGDPLLTVWRKGLGRIAVLSTDNGNYWGGEMYSGINSKIISRTINWGAGDPERKKEYFFSVNDARVGEEIDFVIKGERAPKIDGLNFERISDRTYVASTFSDSVGFFEFEDDEYSVNYNSEYLKLGMNDELENIVLMSGGGSFEEENIEDILDFLKEKKNVISTEKELFVWPLIALAMIIFIVDVWFRTINKRKNI